MLIKHLRKQLGWSQARLARESSLCQSTLSQIESGRLKPYQGQLEKLAQALRWTGDVQDLLGDISTDQENHSPSSNEVE